MKKNIVRKNLRRSITKSLGRYIAIMAIIALGAGLFVGLIATKTDMIATGQSYMDMQNMFDLRLACPVGWDCDSVAAITALDGMEAAEGVITMDVIGSLGGQGDESVYQIYSLPQAVNRVYLVDGRMPTSDDECLVDAEMASAELLGKEFCISDANSDDITGSFKNSRFRVVGYVHSPLFMDIMRGTTTLGNGSIRGFVYLPQAAFDIDYFTYVDVTLQDTYPIYSDIYTEAMDLTAEQLEPKLIDLLQTRYKRLHDDAIKAYNDAIAEYEDGLEEFHKGKAEATSQLQDAYAELCRMQDELDANRLVLENAKIQLEDGKLQLEENTLKLEQSRKELANRKKEVYAQLSEANAELLMQYQQVSENEIKIDQGIQQINEGIAQLDEGIGMIDAGLAQLDGMISLAKLALSAANETIKSAQQALEDAQESGLLGDYLTGLLEERLAQAEEEKKQYDVQLVQMEQERRNYAQQRAELVAQRQMLEPQKAELEGTKLELTNAKNAIAQGFVALQHQTDAADREFAAATSQLLAASNELTKAQITLGEKTAEWETGNSELKKGELRLNEGWSRYYKAVYDTARELIQAEEKLVAAKRSLDEGKLDLDRLDTPEVYVLTRNSNTGYLAVDSNSDIVAGVARVFPAFFLLVASLVCITTMTRMVEEERTQIGTMKALGYSAFAIMRKYLVYAGSAAVLGCGAGVFVGSILFPRILWIAYSLILKLTPDIEIVFDLPLCLGVVATYTAVILGVTWYSCRRALLEVPAQLIRPKAPTKGRKIFLEYIPPLWNKLSFLNKVMLRNIFRYRQRLLMMLVGIGGCAALLLTGFGIGDSIKDIVSYQFDEVTQYDLQVQFADGTSANKQSQFKKEYAFNVENVVFAHQSGVDVLYNGNTKSVYMIAADQDLTYCFDFHSGDQQLNVPNDGEVLLSIGTAESMGVKAGDIITVQNSDMVTADLTISGIFDNNVYNYVIVSPETAKAVWGDDLPFQMAFVTVRPGVDPHTVAANISEDHDVMNIMVSADLASQVGSMLDAMNMVVITVVICAALLAVIVIYNLTNINIKEREREIATIKVLGFYPFESAAYVFKENLLLAVVGAGLGLFGGKFLLDFVMHQIKIDMVWMPPRIAPISWIASVLITILMAVLVDIVLYFRLERINMAQALKAVE